MKIAGYAITKQSEESHISGDTIIIYHHVQGDVYFVRRTASDNTTIRSQRPKSLRDYIKTSPSPVVAYVHSETCAISGQVKCEAIKAHYALRKKLYSKDEPETNSELSTAQELYNVYLMKHIPTGALYYDYDIISKTVANAPVARMVLFNGQVLQRKPSMNRTIYYFAENNFPLKPEDWEVNILVDSVGSLLLARQVVTKHSSVAVKKGFVVLNRIAGYDALTYRNSYLGLIPLTMKTYLENINL